MRWVPLFSPFYIGGKRRLTKVKQFAQGHPRVRIRYLILESMLVTRTLSWNLNNEEKWMLAWTPKTLFVFVYEWWGASQYRVLNSKNDIINVIFQEDKGINDHRSSVRNISKTGLPRMHTESKTRHTAFKNKGYFNVKCHWRTDAVKNVVSVATPLHALLPTLGTKTEDAGRTGDSNHRWLLEGLTHKPPHPSQLYRSKNQSPTEDTHRTGGRPSKWETSVCTPLSKVLPSVLGAGQLFKFDIKQMHFSQQLNTTKCERFFTRK